MTDIATLILGASIELMQTDETTSTAVHLVKNAEAPFSDVATTHEIDLVTVTDFSWNPSQDVTDLTVTVLSTVGTGYDGLKIDSPSAQSGYFRLYAKITEALGGSTPTCFITWGSIVFQLTGIGDFVLLPTADIVLISGVTVQPQLHTTSLATACRIEWFIGRTAL